MNSSHFQKFGILFTIFLLLLNFFVLIQPVYSQNTTNNPTFTVSSTSTRVTLTTPVYDKALNLYMSVDAGILQNFSNPFIRMAYINSQTKKEVFVLTYVFHSLIEYTQVNGSQTGPESNIIDKTFNIGNSGSTGPDIRSRGYYPINVSVGSFDGQITHLFNFTTLNNVFSLQVIVPEGTVYPGGIEVTVPGLYYTVHVKNFPYTLQNSLLSMNTHITTSSITTVDAIGSNGLYFYSGNNQTVNSTLYMQNAFFSGYQSQFLSPDVRDISTYCNFVSTERNNLTIDSYLGNINTNQYIIPDSASNSQQSGSGNAGILDFTVSASAFNFQMTGTQLALGTVTIVGLAGLAYAIYYLIKKYLLFIVGIVVGLAVTIYLPSRKVTAIQALHHDKRREIMDALHEAGEHGMVMKELKELIQLPQTTLLWHLDVLQEFEFITRVKIHKQIIIISNDFLESFDPRLKELELSFQSEQGEKFREFISSKTPNEAFTISEVLEYTKWHEKTLKRHFKRLIHLGIMLPIQHSDKYIIAPEFQDSFSKV